MWFFYSKKRKRRKGMKTNKGMRILLAIIEIVLLSGSTVAFGWWDRMTVNKAEQNIITLGEGLELQVSTVVIDPEEAGNLIPESAVLKTGDTYEIVLTYTVEFERTDLEEELDLAVEVSNIEVNSVANPYGLIKVVVSNPGIIQNAPVTVTLTVTIDESELEPEDYEAAYTALANQEISFDVSFVASRQA